MFVADTQAQTDCPHASENGALTNVLIKTVHLCASRVAAKEPSHSLVYEKSVLSACLIRIVQLVMGVEPKLTGRDQLISIVFKTRVVVGARGTSDT